MSEVKKEIIKLGLGTGLLTIQHPGKSQLSKLLSFRFAVEHYSNFRPTWRIQELYMEWTVYWSVFYWFYSMVSQSINLRAGWREVGRAFFDIYKPVYFKITVWTTNIHTFYTSVSTSASQLCPAGFTGSDCSTGNKLFKMTLSSQLKNDS